MTVHEVSQLTHVSVRTLHYYDEIGLLSPSKITEAGYRIYHEEDLEKLHRILMFRELEFSLKEIKTFMENPDFDQRTVLEEQIKLLELKKEHFEGLLSFAKKLRNTGENNMDFQVYDDKKTDEYKEEARKRWGETDAYREYEEKTKDLTEETKNVMGSELMDVFREFGEKKNFAPDHPEAQELVRKLSDCISAHFYTCTKEILSSLGQMYVTEEFAKNIDAAGGEGTALFASEAIKVYCK